MMPLAECLGVTVTELLLCRKDGGESLTRSDAEKAVQTAIGYTAAAGRVWKGGKGAAVWYAAGLLCAAAATMVAAHLNLLDEIYLSYMGLIAFFGAYFCLFARRRLPDIYDKAPIAFMSDGPVRMNLPGVHFNNRNWPYLLRTAQVWTVASLILFPWLYLALWLFAAPILPEVNINLILLVVVLGSLFVPMTITGKKHE